MTLDNATGLPALPEGYFWRVRHHEAYRWTAYDYRTEVDTSRLQVLLIRTFSGTRTEKQYPKPWYRRTHREITVSYTSEDVQYVEDAEGTDPIAVRNAGHRIVKQWEKAKVRDALIGDYPPKKLGES